MANAARARFIAIIIFAIFAVVVSVGLLLFAIVDVGGRAGMFSKMTGAMGIAVGVLLGAIAPFVFGNWQRNQRAADKVKPTRHCVVEPVVYSD